MSRGHFCCRASKLEASEQGSTQSAQGQKFSIATHDASGFFNRNATDFYHNSLHTDCLYISNSAGRFRLRKVR